MTAHLDAILSRLDGVRPVAGGHLARCPAHADDEPSLKVSLGKGDSVLLHCHAGCTLAQILDALDLQSSALYQQGPRAAPASRREPPPDVSDEGGRKTFGAEPVTTYEWHDETGAVRYQTQRDGAKNFRIRRPKPGADPGEEAWIYDAKGLRLVLYRLPEILFARHAGIRIHVCEGEKDADTLARLGLAATTAPLGAGAKWLRQYTDSLAGARDVVVLPHADEAGRKHAEKVRDALVSEVETLRVLNLPDPPHSGYDVSDFVAAGGTAAELARLADAAPPVADPERRFSSANVKGNPLMSRKIDKPRSILGNGLLSTGEYAFLYGHPGLGKSWLAIQIAFALAQGNGPLGVAGPDGGPARVGLLELELSGYWLQQRFRALLDGQDPAFLDNVNLVIGSDLTGAVDLLGADAAALRYWIMQESLDLVIVDALSRVHGVDENKAVDFGPVLNVLDDVTKRTGAAILVVHHEPKPPAGKEVDDLFALRGTSRMISDPKALIRLVKAKQPGLFQLRFPKANNAPDAKPVWLSRSEGGFFERTRAPEERRNENVEKVHAALLEAGDGGLTIEEIAAKVDISVSTLKGHGGHLAAVEAVRDGAEYAVKDSAGRVKKHRKWRLKAEDRGQETTEDDKAYPSSDKSLPQGDLLL